MIVAERTVCKCDWEFPLRFCAMSNEALTRQIQAIVQAAEPEATSFAKLALPDMQAVLAGMEPEEVERILHSWKIWARPQQIAPEAKEPGVCQQEGCKCRGRWLIWMILAGRGWGKTRVGAEWVHENADGVYGKFHLVGATAADARDIIVEGESGILATQKPWNTVQYSPTKRKLTWENGAQALVFSADEPERLRGVQCEAAWCDELGSWRYPEAWEQLQLGLRLGKFPRTVITTTPRPKILVKDLANQVTTHLTKGITYENLDNLAPSFIAEVVRVYEGTRWGRQELYAEILDDAPGALWTHALIESVTITLDERPSDDEWKKIVVAIDPAVSVTKDSDETGMVVCALDRKGHAYLLEDASGKMKVDEWSRKAARLFRKYKANYIVAEKNQGGDMVEHTIQVYDQTLPVKLVSASRAKETRAEPVATAYEKGLVHHVGSFPVLEDQLCSWEPGEDEDSPDRLDALVWGMTELVVGKRSVVVGAIGKNELGQKNPWKPTSGGGGMGQDLTPWLSPG